MCERGEHVDQRVSVACLAGRTRLHLVEEAWSYSALSVRRCPSESSIPVPSSATTMNQKYPVRKLPQFVPWTLTSDKVVGQMFWFDRMVGGFDTVLNVAYGSVNTFAAGHGAPGTGIAAVPSS